MSGNSKNNPFDDDDHSDSNANMHHPAGTTAGITAPDQKSTQIVVVNVPPGKLGIHLSSSANGGGAGAYISAVNEDSPLAGKVYPGYQVMGIDEVDVSQAEAGG